MPGEMPSRSEAEVVAVPSSSAASSLPSLVVSCNAAAHFNDSVDIEACSKSGFRYYDTCRYGCMQDMSIQGLAHNQDLEEAIYGRIFPILIVFVVAANVMVAVVLSKRHMVTPTNVVLRYMAIADLCVGLTPLPWTLYFYTFGNHRRTEHLELWWCYLFKYSMDAFPPIFHNVAMWLTVLLAGQRYISIAYPLYSRSLCSVKNVRLSTAVIALISITCGLPKSFDATFEVFDGYIFSESGNKTHLRACLSLETALIESLGTNLFFNMYFWTRAVVFIITPCALLIVLNGLLIRGIRRAQQRKLRLLQEKRAREAQRQNDTNSTSLMLVVIVTIFLVVNLPQAIFMVVLCVCNTFSLRLSILESMFPVVFLLVNNMLIMATYPINFAIYCFMSSSFRQTFQALFCHSIRKPSLLLRPDASMLAEARRSETSGVKCGLVDDGAGLSDDQRSLLLRAAAANAATTAAGAAAAAVAAATAAANGQRYDTVFL